MAHEESSRWAFTKIIIGPIITGVVGVAISVAFKDYMATSIMVSVILIALELFVVLAGHLYRINSAQLSMRAELMRLLGEVRDQCRDLAATATPIYLHGIDLQDPIVRFHAKALLQSFSSNVAELVNKDIRLTLELNTTLRLSVLANLRQSAFMTFVVSIVGDLWRAPAWSEYKNGCFEAAKRLPGRFTRVFVVAGPWEITPPVEDLIREHVASSVRTYIAIKADLKRKGLDPEDDFAFWDETWLAQVTPPKEGEDSAEHRVRFQTHEDTRRLYRDKTRLILACSTPADAYLDRQLNESLNSADVLSSCPPPESLISYPLVSSTTFFDHLERECQTCVGRIAVVGCSEPFGQWLSRQPFGEQIDFWEVIPLSSKLRAQLVDARSSIYPLSHNRLSGKRRYGLTVLLGTTNFLAAWQLRSFLTSLSNSMSAKSNLLIYGLIPRENFTAMDLDEANETICADIQEGTTVPAAFARLVPILHSSEYYDSTTHTINFHIVSEHASSAARACVFSYLGPYSGLKITSLPSSAIQQAAAPHFYVTDNIAAFGNVTGWFRIMRFTKAT